MVTPLRLIPRLELLQEGGPLPPPRFDGPGTPYTQGGLTTLRSFAPTELFDSVSSILCVVDQFRTSEMVNQDWYVVVYDQARCATARNSLSAQAPGLTSVDGGGRQARAYVKVTRQDDTSPQRVDAFVPFGITAEDVGSPALVDAGMRYKQLHIEVLESPSMARPYGRFRMQWTDSGSFATTDEMTADGLFGFRFFDASRVGRPDNLMSFLLAARRGTMLLNAAGTRGFALTQNGWFEPTSPMSNDLTLGTEFDVATQPMQWQDYYLRTTNAYRVAVKDGHVLAETARRVSDLGTATAQPVTCVSIADERPFIRRYALYNQETGAQDLRVTMFPYWQSSCSPLNGFIRWNGVVFPPPGCAELQEGDSIEADVGRNSMSNRRAVTVTTLDPVEPRVVLTDAMGTAYSPDDPLMFTYTHTQQNARFGETGGVGQTYQFSWDGQFAGPPASVFPYAYDPQGTIAVPLFSLVDGVAFTDTGRVGGTYVLKARRGDTWFPQVAAEGTCSDVAPRTDLDTDLPNTPVAELPPVQPPFNLMNTPPLYVDGVRVP